MTRKGFEDRILELVTGQVTLERMPTSLTRSPFLVRARAPRGRVNRTLPVSSHASGGRGGINSGSGGGGRDGGFLFRFFGAGLSYGVDCGDSLIARSRTCPSGGACSDISVATDRRCASRMFERLREENGFTGGITTVKDYVALCRRRSQEGFVPLLHRPGHAQADFGEAIGIIGGTQDPPAEG